MLGSNRVLMMFIGGLALAGCLMAVDVIIATSHLQYTGQQLAAGISADVQSTRQHVGRNY
jgi:hypothetical protein